MVFEEHNLEDAQELCAHFNIESRSPPSSLPLNLSTPSTPFVILYPPVQTRIPRSYMVVPIPCYSKPHSQRPMMVSSDQVHALTIFAHVFTDIDTLVDNIAAFYKYLHKYGPICIDPTSEHHDNLAQLYTKPYAMATEHPTTLAPSDHRDSTTQTLSESPADCPITGHPPRQNLFVILPDGSPRTHNPIFVITRCKTPAITIFNSAPVNIETLGENILRNFRLLTQQFPTFHKEN
jgi:hypothetical protein